MTDKPDPLNRRPRNPEWEKRCDEFAEAAAKELGCLVVMVVVQDRGKMGICIGGKDTPGEELDFYRNVIDKSFPHFLRTIADVVETHQGETQPDDNELPTDGRPLEVVIAPGAFDEFEGTPEQLQEMIAEARQMFASGEYLKHSRQLTPEEASELMERIEDQRKKNTRQ